MMTARGPTAATTLLLALACGCGGGGGGPVGDGPVALFDVPAAGSPDPARSPFPSDLFLDEQGRIEVTGLPINEGEPGREAFLAEQLAGLDGFGATASVFFPTTAPIDPTSLVDASAVVLVDLATGARLGAIGRVAPDGETVVVDPALGVVLRERGRYGALVTATVRARDGVALGPAPELAAALAGDASTPERARAAAHLAPLVAALAGLGVEPATVVAASVFTVQSVTAPLRAMVEVAEAVGAPRARITRVFDEPAELDGLLGQISAAFAGRRGLPPDHSGIEHGAIAAVIEGDFEVPYFLATAAGHKGVVDFSAGLPLVRGVDRVPFTLVLPALASYAAIPLVIAQHGINSDRTAVYAVANSLAERGIATIGVDALFHGSRRPDSIDQLNNLTQVPGEDGIGDALAGGAVLHFFDLMPEAGDRTLDLRVIRDNFRQAVVDLTVLTRLVAGDGDLTDLRGATGALPIADLSFDAAHVVYTAESFGSLLGGVLMAVDPRVRAYVLSAPGGGLTRDFLLNSFEFAPVLGLLVQSTYDADANLVDTVTFPGSDQRIFSLAQTILDGADSLAFAPYVVVAPDASGPRNVVVLEAKDDETVPNQATEAMAAALGLTHVTFAGAEAAIDRVALPSSGAPLSGNAAGVTAAIAKFSPSAHSQLTLMEDARTLEPDFPPFILLDAAEVVITPIAEVQELLADFVASYLATGTPEVTAP